MAAKVAAVLAMPAGLAVAATARTGPGVHVRPEDGRYLLVDDRRGDAGRLTFFPTPEAAATEFLARLA